MGARSFHMHFLCRKRWAWQEQEKTLALAPLIKLMQTCPGLNYSCQSSTGFSLTVLLLILRAHNLPAFCSNQRPHNSTTAHIQHEQFTFESTDKSNCITRTPIQNPTSHSKNTLVPSLQNHLSSFRCSCEIPQLVRRMHQSSSIVSIC